MILDVFSLPHKKGSKPDEYIVCCPFCLERKGSADYKYHMGVDLKRGVYHCFRCDASGKISSEQKEYLSPTILPNDLDALIKDITNISDVFVSESLDLDKIRLS